MGRTARDRRDLPHPKPVERIELNEEHVGRRLLLTIVLLLIAAGALAYAVSQFFAPQSEWIAIEANASAGITCAPEFEFLYHLGSGELSPAAERRAVTDAYTRLCRNAFLVFHNQMEAEGVNNLYAINRHPNEELAVDGALYQALAAVERSGNRALYLGPVYDRYGSLFYCEDDSQLVDFDPRLSPEVAREYQEYAAFAGDPRAVRVELLGENRMRLFVSEGYLEYARREGIESFIDFAWMRNAFIADYLARELTALGYTRGVLASCDGFIRCLDESGEEYSLLIYDRQQEKTCNVAVMCYQGPRSIVCLRDFPVNALEETRFYRLRSGEVRTPYVDTADGMCRNALSSLTCYSGDKGCGEILLEMLPVYIAETLREGALEELAAEGTDFVYCEDRVIRVSDPEAVFSQIYEEDGMQYTVAR